MRLQIFLLAVIISSLFLEGVVISFPIFFFVSFLLLSIRKDVKVFIAILFLGLILDILKLNILGITPLSIFAAYLLVIIYEKFFGSRDSVIVLLLAVVATLIYSYFLQYSLKTIAFTFVLMIFGFIIYHFLTSRRLIKF